MADRDTHAERYDRAIAALRDARRAAGVTQADLASKLGARQQFVSKYESGERRLDVIEYLDVAAALDLDISEILRLPRRG